MADVCAAFDGRVPVDCSHLISTQRKLPNGLINGEQLEYTLDHTFDGTAVVLTFSAGPGLESVMAFPTPHEPAAVPMINTGELWTAELTGHQEGEEVWWTPVDRCLQGGVHEGRGSQEGLTIGSPPPLPPESLW